jgi:NAD(P)-dependent dehydrogenase (short-subunit alcohol dehydrogenase family)
MEGAMRKRRFEGEVALITGGSSGIGRATALSFAREGAKVVIASRGVERGEAVCREVQALGGEAEFIATDVSKAQDVESLMRRTVARFGRLDCACNNAAVIDVGMFKLSADFSEEDFDKHIGSNLKSVWLCMKHEIIQMLRQDGGGRIVNTSSVNGLGGTPHNALYAASKAGVLGLTKSAAQEYAKQAIRINALVAGGFDTPMLNDVFKLISPHDPLAARTDFERLVPLGRIGRPEEAAEAVLWLCSSASSYMAGHSLIVDGGMTSPFR